MPGIKSRKSNIGIQSRRTSSARTKSSILQPTNNGEGTHFVSYLQAWWPENTSKATIARLALQWGVPSNFMMHRMAAKMGKLACKDAQLRRANKILEYQSSQMDRAA